MRSLMRPRLSAATVGDDVCVHVFCPADALLLLSKVPPKIVVQDPAGREPCVRQRMPVTDRAARQLLLRVGDLLSIEGRMWVVV